MRDEKITNEEYIKLCEMRGLLDPNCEMCRRVFYPAVKEGRSVTDVFAPAHKASERCRSGKNAHCTCDTCF